VSHVVLFSRISRIFRDGAGVLTSANIFGSFFIIATASVEGVEYSCSLIHLCTASQLPRAWVLVSCVSSLT
jgi:hypothetical protein